MKFETQVPHVEVIQVLTAEKMHQVTDWGVQFLASDELHGRSKGANSAIFILDTGGNTDHPDLVDRLNKDVCVNFSDSMDLEDHDGHATHCAGIACASDDELGVVGVSPKSMLVMVKVLNNIGNGFYSWAAKGVRHAADCELPEHIKHRVISLSLSGPVPDQGLEDAINYAIGKGCFIVAAAGNAGYIDEDTIGYPGKYPQVITVASITREGIPSDFSSGGEEIDVAAPGSDVYSTHLNGGYASLDGTSMAAPHISGLIALLAEIWPSLDTQSKMEAYLKEISEDVYTTGDDVRTGAGVPRLLTPQEATERALTRKDKRKAGKEQRRNDRRHQKGGLFGFLRKLKRK